MSRRVYAYGPATTDLPLGQSFYASTFVLGHTVIQVLGSSQSKYQPFAADGSGDDRSQTILPPIIGGSDWPRPHLLNDAEVEEFGRQFLRATQIVEVSDPNDPRLRHPQS